MVEKTPVLNFLTVFFLIVGIALVGLPIYYCIVAATLPIEKAIEIPMPLIPGNQFFQNLKLAIEKGQLLPQLFNSLIMALGISIGKIIISILSAFAITYFNFKFRKTAFWMIFITLMLPVEVRILPTYEVAANIFSPLKGILSIFNIQFSIQWSLLDSYAGLILPLVASATATFLFRQFFLTIPDELCEAAKVDGASPMQFFFKIILPLSLTNIAALFVIVFVYGWNQYLWPLLITTKPEIKTAIVGVQSLIPRSDQIPQWNVAMAGGLFVMLPPIFVVIVLQRWFVKGVIENEK